MSYIIIDRDGVINDDSDDYIKSADEWHAIPGSLEAIADLNRAGFHVLVASNQSGISRGLFDLETLNQMHEKLFQELTSVGGYIDEIFFCPHQPADNCDCRKPKPGMFYQIQKKYNVDFKSTYFIGDAIADLQVAQAVGCRFLLVLTGKGQRTLEKFPEQTSSIPCFANLAEASRFVLREKEYAKNV